MPDERGHAIMNRDELKITKVDYLIVDTETTGTDPAQDKIVEIGVVKWRPNVGVLWTWSSLVHPERPIPVTAQAVHGITDAMVDNAPFVDEVLTELRRLIQQTDVLVAHHVAFDRAFFPLDFQQNHAWVCSLRLARHVWPDLESHSNQYLRYRFALNVPPVEAHRAAADALVTAALWERIFTTVQASGYIGTVDDLIDYAASPITVETMPFGKHKGTPLRDVPRDYLRWVLANIADLDDDLRYSIQHQLAGEVIA